MLWSSDSAVQNPGFSKEVEYFGSRSFLQHSTFHAHTQIDQTQDRVFGEGLIFSESATFLGLH